MFLKINFANARITFINLWLHFLQKLYFCAWWLCLEACNI